MMSVTKEESIVIQPQESDVILSIDQVSKKFCRDLKSSLLYGIVDITKEIAGVRKEETELRKKEFWALNNLSFKLHKGEALALVGRNGSGKSTLLRIIAGLIKPDVGSVEVNGRLAPLIALGAGFNPILTGRENIYANLSILGLSQQEIDERFQDVVDFSEIGDAIDSPVQSYSSGMAARLGFACAIHTEPDILLIDEVLAVGDVNFRVKCYRRLAELRKQGVSFILVSHNSASVLSICDTAVYLKKGELCKSGDAETVMNQYEEDLSNSSSTVNLPGEVFLDRQDTISGLQIKYIGLKNCEGQTLTHLTSGEPASIEVIGESAQNWNSISLNLIIKDLSMEGGKVLVLDSVKDGKVFQLIKGKYSLKLDLPFCGIKPGRYSIKVALKNSEGYHDVLDLVESFIFQVKAKGNMNQCLYYQPRNWSGNIHYFD